MKLVCLLLLLAGTALAQTLNVTIVDRKDNPTQYTYVVPGTAYASCNGARTFCSASGTSEQQGSFTVNGATLSLLLPDGRVAVVNCESKFQERFRGREGNRRSCRQPLVDKIQVDFNGDKAKLEWAVSLDGKKTQSETYKVLGVLDKPKSN